uniref:TonB-dependent receptor n=1 Tax=Edaphosphingomonas laterariae TaxID=861865 RepID=UPI003183CAE4
MTTSTINAACIPRSATSAPRNSRNYIPGAWSNQQLDPVRLQGPTPGPGNAPALFDPTQSGPPAEADDYIAVHEGPRRYQNNSHFVNLALDWDLGFATLNFVGGHQDTRLVQIGDSDVGNSIPNYTAIQTTRTPYNVDTAELRLVSNGNSFWNWSVGAFYSKQTGNVSVNQKSDRFFVNTPITFGLYLPITADIAVPVNDRQLSISASSSFQFTDKLRLEVGARYSELKSVQTASVTATSPGSPGFPAFGIPFIPAFSSTTDAIPPELSKTKNHPLTGGATLTYEFTPDVTAYAAYGRSFRSGTAGVGVPVNLSNDLIKSSSERSDAFEIGLKTAVLDRRITLNLSAFYQKFDGYISRFPGISYDNGALNLFGQPVGPPDGNVDGAFDFNYNGDATVKGIEATIAGRPIDAWDFSVSAAYVRARFDDAVLPCNDFNGDGEPDSEGDAGITGPGNVSYCASNGRLGDVPDFSLTANTEVRFTAGDLEPFVRALFSYRPSVFSERSNFDYQSRELLDLYVGMRGLGAGWEVSLFAKNVLNQRRITNISQGESRTATDGGDYLSGYRIINATNPREFGITTSYRF